MSISEIATRRWHQARHSLLRPAQRVANRAGFEIVRRQPDGTEREVYASLSSRPVTMIFDVGANVGAVAGSLSRAFPSATIVAFEPLAANFAVLTRSAAGNPRIMPQHLAVGSEDGTGSMEYLDIPDIRSGRLTAGPGRETVSQRRIDSFCRDRRITHIDILKSDTEGSEVAVMTGAGEMLRRTRFVLVEFGLTPGDPLHTHLEDLVRCLAPSGHKLVNLFETRYRPASGSFSYGNALFFNADA